VSEITKDDINGMQDDIKRLVVVIDGDPQTDTVGLRVRVQELTDVMTEIKGQWNRMRWILYGAALGIGLLQIVQISTISDTLKVLAALASKLPAP
jgi:hypothetical protein